MFGFLGSLDFGNDPFLRRTGLDRHELRIVGLFALVHLLLDGFKALADHTGAALYVTEHGLQEIRTFLE